METSLTSATKPQPHINAEYHDDPVHPDCLSPFGELSSPLSYDPVSIKVCLGYFSILDADRPVYPHGIGSRPFRTREQAESAWHEIKKAAPEKNLQLVGGAFFNYKGDPADAFYLVKPLPEITNPFERVWLAQIRAEIALRDIGRCADSTAEVIQTVRNNAIPFVKDAMLYLQGMLSAFHADNQKPWTDAYAYFAGELNTLDVMVIPS